MDYSIYKASSDDVKEINDILNHYIDTSGANWAWHPRSEEEAMRWYFSHDFSIHPIFVAKSKDGKVIGFASLSPFRAKEGYWPVAENSLYLQKDYTRQKIGSKLMETLLDFAYSSKLEVVTAWIDSENVSSIEFHKNWGFEIVGEMKNVGDKFNTRRSVTIMQLSVIKEEL
ncbi:MAG: N-acetyltransferase family protein [Eubacteriales bacterium]